MYITESELRSVVQYVLLKESLSSSLLLESNRDFLYEAVLNEISIRHQLLPIIFSIAPIFGCTKDDIKNGTVTPHAVAAAKAVSDNSSTQLTRLSPNDQKIATTYCSRVNYHSIKGFYINSQGQRISAGPTINWKSCDNPDAVKRIVSVMTNEEGLQDAAEDQLEVDVVHIDDSDSSSTVPSSPHNSDSCKVVHHEDGTATVVYSPFCFNVDVGGLSPDEQEDLEKPYDPNMSSSEMQRMHDRADAEYRDIAIQGIRGLLKDRIIDGEFSANLLKAEVELKQRGQKNLLALYPQMKALNIMWNNTNGSPEVQKKIDEFMKAVEKAYDKDAGQLKGY